MTADIFSRFRAPDPTDDDGSGSEYRRTGGLAQVAESEVLDAIDRAPSLPHIVGQVLQRVGDAHSSTADLEKLIEQDMVLAGKVLKLVNSAFYRRPQPVGSIREAVSIIGFASLRSVVLAASTSNILLVDHEPYPDGGRQGGGRPRPFRGVLRRRPAARRRTAHPLAVPRPFGGPAAQGSGYRHPHRRAPRHRLRPRLGR
jgi:hypothetical protein